MQTLEGISMTSLVAVLAVDQRGPCALYLMTDSRITWTGHQSEWDAGQKTFSVSNKAHVFGFCGNASFPPSVARQLVEQIEAGLVGSGNDPDVVRAEIKAAVEWAHSVATKNFFDGFSIFHGFREGEFMESKFHLRRIEFFCKHKSNLRNQD